MNKTGLYELTIVVPVYNEEDNMDRLEKELSAFVKSASLKVCVLFVDDGSKDKSLERLRKMCDSNPSFFYIGFAGNKGLTAAIKAGIDTTESPYVAYIDADLQTSPEDFELLFPHRKEYELVMGIRTQRKDTTVKRISSKIANGFRRMMTGDNIQDTGCPLKVMKTEYAKRIPMFTGMHRFIPALIQLQKGKVKEIPVRHFNRTAGVSKYHLRNRLAGPFMDCFAFRWMRKRYINYYIETANISNQQ